MRNSHLTFILVGIRSPEQSGRVTEKKVVIGWKVYLPQFNQYRELQDIKIQEVLNVEGTTITGETLWRPTENLAGEDT
jgi:hypothetical protein